MNAQSIISEIEGWVAGSSYEQWTVGVTDEPGRRREDHGGPTKTPQWREWDAYTENDARYVERHFLRLGMRGGPGRADYVYVFQ